MDLFFPSSRLITAAGDSQQAWKFTLVSREWFELQNQVQAILALPLDLGEYGQRYGDASSGSQMKECFDAMYVLRNVASKYGNPKSLRASIFENPNFLADPKRPKNDAFSATVWTIQLAHNNAFQLASALRNIPSTARGEQPSEVVAGIKSLFLDTDQIVDKMRQTAEQLDVLIKEFQALEGELEESQTAMTTYTERSSKTRISLDTEIGELKERIAELEKYRDDAYDKWLALTVSACVFPAVIGIVGTAITVILTVPSGGTAAVWAGGITTVVTGIAATALGTAASNARTSYDGLIQEVSSKQEYLQKRIAYRHDLGALDKLMKFSLPTSSGVISQLKVVKASWESSIEEMRYKVNALSTETLADGPWLKEQEMAASAANWSKVDDALKAFINGSFVDSNLIPFGSSLPKDDPDWQKKLVSRLAA